MTTQELSAIAGVLLSLVFSYAPGAKDWFETLTPTFKRLVMLGLLLMATGGVFGLACGQVVSGIATCDRAGAIELARIFVTAVVANQSAFLISPKRAK